MRWQVLAVIVLFLWHEAEEYRVLLPWLERNRRRLPKPLRRLHLSPLAFKVIAAEELLLLILASFLPSVWFSGAVVAYGLHLLIHCGQMVYTKLHDMPLRLWSSPLQLPLLGIMLTTMPTTQSANLGVTSAVMAGVMVLNLAVMHWVTHLYSGKLSK